MESVNDVLRDNDVLLGIALHVFHGNYGGFLTTYADAYIQADSENEKIVRPTWMQLIDKYLLRNNGVVQEEGEGR